jgi:phosphate-selective porin OprO and OprP
LKRLAICRWQIILPIAFTVVFAVGFTEAAAGSIRPDCAQSTQAVALNESDSSGTDTLSPLQKPPEGGLSIISGSQLRLTGYTQVRAQIFQPEAGNKSGADLRRIRFTLSGKPAKLWQYLFQAEFATSPKALDAYVRFSPFTYFVVTAGQFKIAFSRENLNPAGTLEFVDRPQAVEALSARSTDVIGNQNGRDIGVQLSGSLTGQDGASLLEYAVGVFNGSGINASDNNNAKDFCGRVVLHPLEGLDFGGSYYNGFDKWGNPLTSHSRTRLGLEFGFVYRSLDLAGEYISGNDGPVKRNGWYVQTACFVIRKVFQVAARYDAFDADAGADGMTTMNYVFGANYFIAPTVKLQANYLMRREALTQIKNDVVEIQLQYGFED